MMKLLTRSLAALFLLAAAAAAPAMAQTAANGPWMSALGSPNDAGCSYTSGKASIPCLLATMLKQAAPTSIVGTSIAAGTQIPGFQGVTGGVPLNVAMAGVATAANQNSTAAGTSATSAQGVQGVTGGVPLNVTGTLTTKSGIAIAGPAYRIAVSAAGSNAQLFATGAKQVLTVWYCNKATSDRVIKFYDKASVPVPGTDPIAFSVPALAGVCAAGDVPAGGFPFALGVGVAVTLPGDADTGSTVAAGDIMGLNIFHN